jgi:hypothetical protein
MTMVPDFGKPADTLIKRSSDAVGGLFRPWQIKRIAKAQAKAALTMAQAEIDVTELKLRAFQRLAEEEAKRQSNVEEIVMAAVPLVTEDSAKPEDIEEDWLANFFDKCRIVSDSDMQRLWGQVLAGEANAPGAFSKRTVNLLGDLEKRDAELFRELCGFVWAIGGHQQVLVLDEADSIYAEHGITFSSLSHLDTLGLVRFETLTGFVLSGLPKMVSAFFFGRHVLLTLPSDKDNRLELGKVIFTAAGGQLARVCEGSAVPVEGLFDFVYDKWASASYVSPRAAPES